RSKPANEIPMVIRPSDERCPFCSTATRAGSPIQHLHEPTNPSPPSTSTSLSINRSIAHQIRPTNPSAAGWSAIRSTFIHPPSSSH
ncbi:hypothetical protein ACLOJK_021320, partial [Asimina triloba]